MLAVVPLGHTGGLVPPRVPINDQPWEGDEGQKELEDVGHEALDEVVAKESSYESDHVSHQFVEHCVYG